MNIDKNGKSIEVAKAPILKKVPYIQEENEVEKEVEKLKSEPIKMTESEWMNKEVHHSQDMGWMTRGEILDWQIGNKKDKHKSIKELLRGSKISHTEIIKKPISVWELKNTNTETYDTIATLGDFSVISGKPKSKKTFASLFAVSSALTDGVILDRFRATLPKEQNKVLYFDTEQSKYHVQLSLKRILKLSNLKELDNLEVYGLRKFSPSERLEIIDYAINNTKNLGFVVIDGVRDLVTSINDESEACKVTSKLLKWTEEKNIHIMTVLHQNKGDDNLRGHLGTEILNKAQTVINVKVDSNNKDVSIVEAGATRDKAFEPFAFSIDSDGLPYLVDEHEFKSKGKSDYNRSKGLLNLLDADKLDILKRAFGYEDNTALSYAKLTKQIHLATRDLQGAKGTNAIQTFQQECSNNDLIIKDPNNNKKWILGEL